MILHEFILLTYAYTQKCINPLQKFDMVDYVKNAIEVEQKNRRELFTKSFNKYINLYKEKPDYANIIRNGIIYEVKVLNLKVINKIKLFSHPSISTNNIEISEWKTGHRLAEESDNEAAAWIFADVYFSDIYNVEKVLNFIRSKLDEKRPLNITRRIK